MRICLRTPKKKENVKCSRDEMVRQVEKREKIRDKG
jgi:hypothetical protein